MLLWFFVLFRLLYDMGVYVMLCGVVYLFVIRWHVMGVFMLTWVFVSVLPWVGWSACLGGDHSDSPAGLSRVLVGRVAWWRMCLGQGGRGLLYPHVPLAHLGCLGFGASTGC